MNGHGHLARLTRHGSGEYPFWSASSTKFVRSGRNLAETRSAETRRGRPQGGKGLAGRANLSSQLSVADFPEKITGYDLGFPYSPANLDVSRPARWALPLAAASTRNLMKPAFALGLLALVATGCSSDPTAKSDE